MKSQIATKLNKIINIVGKPFFAEKNVLLYKMDCIEFMEKLNTPMIDLTVTSPPYNIGKEYEKKKDLNEYINWSEMWMRKTYQITKRNGAFLLNLGYFKVPTRGLAVPIPYLIWNKNPFYLIQEIVWHYEAGVASYRMFSPRNEKYLWYVKNHKSYTFNLNAVRDKNVKYPNQKKNGVLKVNPNGKNPTNVWSIPKVTSGNGRSSIDRTPHPAQMPIDVVNMIIRACSNRNNLVFDPFIGSGTVAIASLMNDRLVIGCEIKSEYLEIAKNRIKKFLENNR